MRRLFDCDQPEQSEQAIHEFGRDRSQAFVGFKKWRLRIFLSHRATGTVLDEKSRSE